MGLASIPLYSTRTPTAMDSDAGSHAWSDSLRWFSSGVMVHTVLLSLGTGSRIMAGGSSLSAGGCGIKSVDKSIVRRL